MLQLSPQSRIFLATEPIDFRKGMDGLAAVCRQVLGDNPLSYRGRDAGHPAPPAQIRTCGTTAYGSYRGCIASKRTLGNGCRMRWVGIQR
jgi:hypothetical protein